MLKNNMRNLPDTRTLRRKLSDNRRLTIIRGLSLIVLTLLSVQTWARIVEEVNIKESDAGYELEFLFFSPMRFVSMTPQGRSSSYEIQLNPELLNIESDINGLNDRNVLSWNKDIWTPIKDIVYDGSAGDYPQIILRFSDKVELKVRSSADLRSLVVFISSDHFKKISQPPIASGSTLLADLQTDDEKLNALLTETNQAFLDQNYPRAIQLLTKINTISSGLIKRRAQEMIGVARERNGQLAHAKREYEIFIEEYPEGDDTNRVRQRLASLVTAARTEVTQRKETAPDSWQTEFYGSFAQRYYRDETTPEDADSITLRDQLVTDLDFVGKAKKGDVQLKTQFIGSYRDDFDTENDDEFMPNIASVEVNLLNTGFYGRLGRQSRTTGGVLGRFDGVHGAYDIAEDITINAVYGYPVLIEDKNAINDSQEFYGTSVDFRDIWGGWDLTGFYITQDNEGVKDREAIGSELRYIDEKKSYFTLVDYDIYFDELNIFLFLGNWNYSDATRFTLNLDYRNSPVLTKTNAIQGQGVLNLDELFDVFSDEELKQLAMDRTAVNKTVTGTVTHELSKKWQVIGELTATEFDDTPASGGVEAIPGTDTEYYVSTQLIGNQFMYDNDIVIFGLRYGDTTNADTYTLTGNWRVNINRKLRVNPRLRLDYRENKDDSGNRVIVKPFIRVDYNLRKWVKFEMDLGYEWYDEQLDVGSFRNNSYYFSMGYRIQF